MRGSATARLVVVIAVALVAGACATPTAVRPPASAGAPLAPRAVADSFTASGRIAARVVGDSKRGFSGGYSWTHVPAEDKVELLTPLGQVAARMRVTPAGAEVELSDGTKTVAADAQRYLSDALGLPLPLSALPRWLQAVPLADTTYRVETDAVGRPTTLWQSGWEVQYTEYADGSPTSRPTRMTLSQGGVEARMIVSEWSVP